MRARLAMVDIFETYNGERSPDKMVRAHLEFEDKCELEPLWLAVDLAEKGADGDAFHIRSYENGLCTRQTA